MESEIDRDLALWIIQHMHKTYTPPALEHMLDKARQDSACEILDKGTQEACRILIEVARENKYISGKNT